MSACASHGYRFFAGVPCSYLQPLINCASEAPDLDYVAASSEGEAVAIASGAYLAGTNAVVMCQNSGLGNAVNPLTSLNFPFRIPLLLIVSLRGEPGLGDEPQHELMGQVTGALLDVLQIPWTYLPHDPGMLDKTLAQAREEMDKTQRPFALVVRKGVLARTDLAHAHNKPAAPHTDHSQGGFSLPRSERMSRTAAIQVLKRRVSGKDALVATTGKIGRELFALGDSENQLYVVGSMGCAAGIGFGIQYVIKGQRVIVLDGDGAALMKMGTLATIGHYRPTELVHVILDNESYESTGGQFTVSSSVDFCTVAAGCGYRQCFRVDTERRLEDAIDATKTNRGPSLIHVKVAGGSRPGLGRPDVKPMDVKRRFAQFLKPSRSG